MIVHVNLGQHSYDVVIEKGLLSRVDQELNLNRKVLVVTDSGVPKEYAQFVADKSKEAVIGLIQSGEDNKSLESWQKLLKLMLDNNFTRGDCVVAVGGGIVGDLAGFVAASYMRGLDFYNIPTTVLSQVDSSVGGKTGVNFNGVKNIVGAFHQPKKVLIDADLLKTLPKRQIANGLSEALKMAMTFDKDTVELFKIQDPFEKVELLVQKSIEIKARVVEADEKESGLRRVLNFGHTLGHGIETNCDEKFYHGECVALGMIPMCSEKVRSELIPLLKKLGLPTSCKINIDDACNAIKHDKKAGKDSIHTIYVNEIGTFEQKDMSLQELRSKLEMVIDK
ncbi:MAG: 3-dehydroquinate synthase [Treponema sp.]|nr:3-dehydroquinate synthase [Treponema sp.]